MTSLDPRIPVRLRSLHEAGHVVAQMALGLTPFDYVTLRPDDADLGGLVVQRRDCTGFGPFDTATIAFAGPMAQGGRQAWQTDKGAFLRSIVAERGGGGRGYGDAFIIASALLSESEEREAERRAWATLARHERAVRTIARQLERWATLTYDDVCKTAPALVQKRAR